MILTSVPRVWHRPGTGQSLTKSWLPSARGDNGEGFVECNLAGPTHIYMHASLGLSKPSSRNPAGRSTLAQATGDVDTSTSGQVAPGLDSPPAAPISLQLEAQVPVPGAEWKLESDKEVV